MSAIDFLPILAIVAVMYFLLWRPQMQEKKNTEDMLAALAKDDRVVTIGGVHAKVVEVGPSTVVLEIGEKTRVTFEKSAVAKKIVPGAPA